jgi:hypothetical protein
MRKLLFGSLLIAVAAACAGMAKAGAPGATLAITHVTVVDVAGGPSRADQTVLISGNRIVQVAPAAQVRVPRGARVVDGAGKWLIPGLWDMHTHVSSLPGSLELHLANGVTGVRDMGAERFAAAKAWRDSIAAGQRVGPRMKISSPVVERPEWLEFAVRAYREAGASVEWAQERFGPRSADEMVRWVDSVAALGADHIKVRNWPSREINQALLARAAHHRLPVVGHGNHPFPMTGIASVEHSVFPPSVRFDSVRDSVFRGWAERGTVMVPTLVTRPGRLQPIDTLIAWLDPARTPAFRYVPLAQREDWRKELDARKAETPMDWQAVSVHDMRNLREMRAAGVTLLAATDAPAFPVVPGFAIHDELANFVDDLGMTPLEALRAATLHPARFLGMADSLGTVEAGRLADLLLLDADPLADIRNTRRIHAVFANGRYLDRPALDALLARVEAAAAGP